MIKEIPLANIFAYTPGLTLPQKRARRVLPLYPTVSNVFHLSKVLRGRSSLGQWKLISL